MRLQKIIVFLGPPGSGKGTQSKLLVEKLGYAYFSMGDTLRQYAKHNTELGREIKNSIEQGIIVEDDAARQVALESFEKALDHPGLVLEGYPRTPGQVVVLDEFIQANKIVDLIVLSIDVDKDRLLERLSLRKTCPNCQAMYKPGAEEYRTGICSVCGHKIEARVDDLDLKFVEKRFLEYEDKTAKIIDHYEQKGNVVHINGDQSENADESIRKVHQEILQKLQISND